MITIEERIKQTDFNKIVHPSLVWRYRETVNHELHVLVLDQSCVIAILANQIVV